MTSLVSRLPFSLDPLIAEARQRARRRRVLVAAALALVVVGAAAGVLAARSPAGATGRTAGSSLSAGTRSCGVLGVGIGWHVTASSSFGCRSGRAFVRAYFQPDGRARSRAQGYVCTSRYLSVGERIRCVRGPTTVTATSEGY